MNYIKKRINSLKNLNRMIHRLMIINSGCGPLINLSLDKNEQIMRCFKVFEKISTRLNDKIIATTLNNQLLTEFNKVQDHNHRLKVIFHKMRVNHTGVQDDIQLRLECNRIIQDNILLCLEIGLTYNIPEAIKMVIDQLKELYANNKTRVLYRQIIGDMQGIGPKVEESGLSTYLSNIYQFFYTPEKPVVTPEVLKTIDTHIKKTM